MLCRVILLSRSVGHVEFPFDLSPILDWKMGGSILPDLCENGYICLKFLLCGFPLTWFHLRPINLSLS